jgi:hypothetical protein
MKSGVAPISFYVGRTYTPQVLDSRTAAFLLQTEFSGRVTGSRLLARLLSLRCSPDEIAQAVDRIFTVAGLRTKAARVDDQDAVFVDPVAGQAHQACAHALGQRGGPADIETQLHRSGNSIHVLPARAGCPDEVELQFIFIERNVFGDLNHGLSIIKAWQGFKSFLRLRFGAGSK